MSEWYDEWTRRNFLAASAGALLTPLADLSAAATNTAPPSTAQTIVITEGTNFAAAVSPDGELIAIDLLGMLWLLPSSGGRAQQLTDSLADCAHPHWSPDGASIVFQSYRDGNFHVWSIARDGRALRQLTRGPFDCREPQFSPDGKRIAFASDRGGSYGIHALDLRSGAIAALTDSSDEEYEPAWSPDGKRIAFVKNKTIIETIVVDDTADVPASRKTIASIARAKHPFLSAELHNPVWSADGSQILYTRIDNGVVTLFSNDKVEVDAADIFPFRPSWLSADEFVYTANGKIWRRRLGASAAQLIEFSVQLSVAATVYKKKQRDFDTQTLRPVRGIASPALSPDGQSIAFCALNELWLLRRGGTARALTRDSYYKCHPAWSPAGDQLVYSSDRGGKLDLWIRDLALGADRQLTFCADAALSSAWSRDAKTIAFLDQRGALYTVDVESGAVRQLHEPLWEPGRPSWSADGETIALAAFKPYSARFREGLSEILTIDRHSGATNYYAPLEQIISETHASLSTRGDDGPVWSPDGRKLALVIDSVLWLLPVDAQGRPNGVPQKLNDETTDAPSWSGDSQSLLYLSNGDLRMISSRGGAPITIPMSLTWRNAKPKQRTIVRVGKLWDGVSDELRNEIDIVIEDNKIVALAPWRERVLIAEQYGDAKFIDASLHTALPGLMDMHTHRQMQGYGYGDRQGRLWLAFGITTTRSPGGPAYHSVEDREAIDAGARIGPRHFTTGEALDGTRIFYNFMRPVRDDRQLALELQRADALSYDLLKTYVRLPNDRQRQVIEWAHRHGVHTASHYLYPNIAIGGDAMEHMGATSRLGYSRSVSASGVGYQDVIALFAASRAVRTPTLFGASVLLTGDDTLLHDRRVRALYPPWEYKKLEEKVDDLRALDQRGIRTGLANQVAQVRAMLSNGGRVIAGTDAPIDHVALSLHLNLRAMVRYGLTPLEALRTATSAPGEFLEAPLGIIAPGKLADIAIIAGNPLERIEDAANVQRVIKNGEVFSIDELLGPFTTNKLPTAEDKKTLAAFTPPASSLRSYWWHHAEYVESGRCACCADGFSRG